jgi:hypothetical protein
VVAGDGPAFGVDAVVVVVADQAEVVQVGGAVLAPGDDVMAFGPFRWVGAAR